jgi:hypothetical protein
VLAALFLAGLFSTEFADSDSWWHLKTGEYIWQHHKLPVPDPFAYTTYLGQPAYAGEEKVRQFNLTHEWLAQAMFYLAYAAGGFPGLILFRALLLLLLCGVAGLLAWRRSGHFYLAVGAALLTGEVATRFTSDRPYLFGFLFLALVIAALEYRRYLWGLPLLFAVWSNMHGGYFLGWVPLGVYCIDAWLRKEPLAEQKKLWMVSAASVLASGLNPNGFLALWVLKAYRESPMQTAVIEWQHTAFWELSWFSVVLFGGALALLTGYRRVRPADWMLYGLFAGAAIWAVRNTILVGFLGPILMAAYFPWKRALPRAAEFVAAALLLAGLGAGVARGTMFQLRPAMWRYPAGPADFLLSHHITGRIFNTYASGGFLMWRLWPNQQVFMDGRALNESLYPDYLKIALQDDESMLTKYGVDVIVVEGFESAGIYPLPAILSDPAQKEWKLVYQDAQGMVFMRHPPPGMQVLNSFDALASMESQCTEFLRHGPNTCGGLLMKLFEKIGDQGRAAKWSAGR